jgi:hypothetical protein
MPKQGVVKMHSPFDKQPKKTFQIFNTKSFQEFFKPVQDILPNLTPLNSRGNRPLKLDFEHHIKTLAYFHLEEFTSGRHLIQTLQEDDFASSVIAPPGGIEKSSFFEANNNRGIDQFLELFQMLYAMTGKAIPKEYSELGNLVAIDGSFIDAVLSMYWADYKTNKKKARIHLGFDINHSIPKKINLTDGKAGERPFVNKILDIGDTGIMDRGYQCHKNFDEWQEAEKHFVCRIKNNTTINVIQSNEIAENSIVFYDSVVILGTPDKTQTKKTVRLVKYSVNGSTYCIATDRHDLTAEQIALIYKLRWDIEKFFAWWKRHMRVYHLIARSEHGLFVQILSGLITFLLLSIYCQNKHGEKVNIKRVRELRNKIMNESRQIAKSEKTLEPTTERNSEIFL